jgi:predicted transcriptional regulator
VPCGSALYKVRHTIDVSSVTAGVILFVYLARTNVRCSLGCFRLSYIPMVSITLCWRFYGKGRVISRSDSKTNACRAGSFSSRV